MEKHLRVFINRVAFRFHSDRVLFRFLIDRIFFRTFCDRATFESSVLGSSSVSAVLDSSVGSSALFFYHAAIFLSNRAATFFHQKQMFCFTLYSQRKVRTQQNWQQKKKKKYLHHGDTKCYTENLINFPIYKLSILLNIQQLYIA